MPTPDSPLTTDKRIQLRDGRSLGYAEYGDPAGKPVVFFQGTPSSRLFRHPDESIAASLGARIITMDRPGFGLSDSQAGRTLLDWPDDVVELADALEIDRFAVAGISGGGPYVAACAFKIPHRLTKAAIISGVGPTDSPEATQGMPRARRLGVTVARHAPWLLRPLLWLVGNPRRNPERYFEQITTQVSESDRVVLAQPEIRAMLIENWAEATHAGIRGFAWESLIFSHPWGFRLEDITMEIHLWHGEEDVSTPLPIARYMASAIPNCHATFLPGEGHFLLFNHWEEILAVLVS
jgi:pimeloyl-ACP methyl ester carboxylesterase